MVPIRWLIPFLALSLASPAGAQSRWADEPTRPPDRAIPFKDAPSYDAALGLWRSARDINAWIGANFTYDRARAIALSETRRETRAQPPAIHDPASFHEGKSGICVDLSRFAVETLRRIDPDRAPFYLMIEFAPLRIGTDVLRLHWLAGYREADGLYLFADSWRPGWIAGPYASIDDFIAAYARERERTIVAWRDLPDYRRQRRASRTPGG